MYFEDLPKATVNESAAQCGCLCVLVRVSETWRGFSPKNKLVLWATGLPTHADLEYELAQKLREACEARKDTSTEVNIEGFGFLNFDAREKVFTLCVCDIDHTKEGDWFVAAIATSCLKEVYPDRTIRAVEVRGKFRKNL